MHSMLASITTSATHTLTSTRKILSRYLLDNYSLLCFTCSLTTQDTREIYLKAVNTEGIDPAATFI